MLRLCILLLFILALPLRAASERFYLGTYTNGTASQGIYTCTIDSNTGKLGPITLAAAAQPDPTFLALSPDGRWLFAALSSELVSYRIQPGGTLRELSRQPSCGPNTCGLSLDPTGSTLYAASYDAGAIGAWPVDAAGRIGAPISHLTFTGSGPNIDHRQQSSHPHCIELDPENRFAYVCDLGADRIWILRREGDGKLVPARPASAWTLPGAGPRHLAFSPDGRLVYVVNELSAYTTVYARDPATGGLRDVDSFPNIDITAGWARGTGSAEIAVDLSRQWLLVSTRLKDFFAVFRINANFNAPRPGTHRVKLLPSERPLYARQLFPSPVKFPRSFALDPTGRWLIAAGETDNRITVMKFDPATGHLTPTDQFASIPRPVCVLFAR